ncbi:MAG: hypothetical protein CMF31_06910 [Kordiimonas sp.]|nr:hypothetical protein [Kordiimonas sp.]
MTRRETITVRLGQKTRIREGPMVERTDNAGLESGDALSLGQTLQRARTAKGIATVDPVAAETCIPVYYLEAIEADAYDKMPEGCYAAGFVKTYAEFIGLDGVEMVRLYRAATEEVQVADVPVSASRGNAVLGILDSVRDVGFSGRGVKMAAAVLMVGGGSLWMSSLGGLSENLAAVDSIMHNSDETLQVDDSHTVLATSSDKKRGLAMATAFRFVEKANANTVETLESPSSQGLRHDQLRIIAYEDTWLRIVDGEEALYINQVLRAGEQFEAPARRDLVMTTSNVGALRFYRGAEALGPAGAYGDIRQNVTLSTLYQ